MVSSRPEEICFLYRNHFGNYEKALQTKKALEKDHRAGVNLIKKILRTLTFHLEGYLMHNFAIETPSI